MNELSRRNDNMTILDENDLSPAQQRVLEMCLDPECYGLSVTEKCNLEKYKMARQTYYATLRLPGFSSLVNRRAKDLIGERIGEVLQASIKAATTGGVRGFQDRKLLLEMFGTYTPRQDIALSTENPLQAQVQAMTDSELWGKIQEFVKDNPEILTKNEGA